MAYVAAHNILSPLGATSEENFAALLAGQSAVREQEGPFGDGTTLWASLLQQGQVSARPGLTRFENLLIDSISAAQATTTADLASERTLFIISTTKGNIELLEQAQEVTALLAGRLNLHSSATTVARHFSNPVKPVVISNACISGVMALLYARRQLQSGKYDTAVVAGADTIGHFVLSGFRAFQALSASRCRPFSQDRDGINLGEAAATIILTNTPAAQEAGGIRLSGGAITNDANHISGPSRTGAELANAIDRAMAMAQVKAAEVNCISAHGTATVYNDEMEAKAFRLSSLHHTPVFSIKGALGHTLGAAGVVESVLLVKAMEHGQLLPTAGFSKPMPEHELRVMPVGAAANVEVALKTASGFGGCNGALVFARSN